MAPSNSRKKAKHEANQESLDRMWEKHEQVSKQPNSKFVYTISKAIKSLQACPVAITTTKEAKALRGVGDSIARMIIKKQPTSDKKEAPSLSRSSSIASTATASVATEAKSLDSDPAVKGLLKRKDPPPPPPPDGKIEVPKLSEKKKAYDKAVKVSEGLDVPKGGWKVVLVVDGREHGWEKVLAKLQMSGVPSEKRHLPIGDMAWIAKSGDTEVMLGTIVERKAVADLASSLYGTRYNEQRLRLQNCGLPQVFLLVEGDTRDVSNCPHDTLHMAMMETRVQLGFQVVQTRHLEDSIRFLKTVHRRILQRAFPGAFGSDTIGSSLPSFASPNANRRRRRKSIKKRDETDRRSLDEMVFDIPPEPALGAVRFITYHELKCKIELDREEGTKTIRAIFCGMLKQIPKVSNSTVPPLVHAFRTPNALFRALDGLSEEEGKNLLADLETGTKRVGDQKALEVYHTFMVGGDDDIAAPEQPPLSQSVPVILSTIDEASPGTAPKAAVRRTIVPAASPKSRKPLVTTVAIAATRPSAPPDTEITPGERPGDDWEDWEVHQTDGLKQRPKDARQSYESIDSVDALYNEFMKPTSTRAAPIMLIDSSSDDDSECEGKIAFARQTATKKLAPRQPKNVSNCTKFYDGLNRTDRTSISRESCDRDKNIASKASRPQKRILTAASPIDSSSESEEEIPLNERIKRLRAKFDTAKASLKSNPRQEPAVREVSLSSDDDEEIRRNRHQEVIELSD